MRCEVCEARGFMVGREFCFLYCYDVYVVGVCYLFYFSDFVSEAVDVYL